MGNRDLELDVLKVLFTPRNQGSLLQVLTGGLGAQDATCIIQDNVLVTLMYVIIVEKPKLQKKLSSIEVRRQKCGLRQSSKCLRNVIVATL